MTEQIEMTTTRPSAEASPIRREEASMLDQAIDRDYRHERRLRARDLALAVLTPLVLLGLWELAARIGVLDARLFTPPSEIAQRGWQMIVSGELWGHIAATVARLAVGLVLGAVVGILAGLLMGVWRPVRAAFGPMFTALYALPKIAILPLLLLVFGLTETPKVLAVAISVFFVMQINTLAGILQIDARILEAARAYRATGWKLFTLRRCLPDGVAIVYRTRAQVAEQGKANAPGDGEDSAVANRRPQQQPPQRVNNGREGLVPGEPAYRLRH